MPSWKRVIVSGSDASLNNITLSGNLIVTGSTTVTSLIVSESLFQYGTNTDVDTGTETVISIPTGSYRAAFFDYVVTNSTNARAGTVMAVWNGTTVEYTEASTTDIGNTTDLNLTAGISGSNVILQARAFSDNWSVKTLARLI
jgi:hypothetical protein